MKLLERKNIFLLKGSRVRSKKTKSRLELLQQTKGVEDKRAKMCQVSSSNEHLGFFVSLNVVFLPYSKRGCFVI